MTSITVDVLQHNIEQLIDYVNDKCVSIAITNGKNAGAVLVGEHEWAAIKETLHLNGIPYMTESIKVGMIESIETCLDEKQIR